MPAGNAELWVCLRVCLYVCLCVLGDVGLFACCVRLLVVVLVVALTLYAFVL